MMRQLRQNTKIILWIVVIAFVTTIFAVWGMDLKTGSTNQDPNILGRVNGQPISRAAYRSAYEMLASQVRSMSPDGQLSYSQLEMIQDQAWQNVVISMLTNQEIEKLNIKVTDEEVLNYLRTTPPPEIQRYFLDDEGNFNYQAYQQALNDPNADWTNLENFARQRIPIIKLNQYIGSQVHVTSEEVRRAYERDNTRMVCSYVEFPYDEENVEDYQPSGDEIQAYYDSHVEDYTESEKASVELVILGIEPSAADKEDIVYTMGVVRGQIEGGEDFASLAHTYSQAPTSDNGGETGWIGAGDRPAPVIDTLAVMKNGELSEPVETNDGYYLLKRLEERSTAAGGAEYDAREIFMRLTPSSSTLDSLLVLADDLQKRAEIVGLSKAAEEMGYEVLKPKPFAKNFPVAGVGFLPGLDDFAFNSNPGAISKVLRDETRYCVCQLISRTPSAPKSLADVEESIRKTLVFERSKQLAGRKAEELFKDAAALGFEAAVENRGMKAVQPDTFKVNDDFADQGPQSELARTILQLPVGSISPPIETRSAYFIVHLLYKTPINEEDLQNKAPAITNRLYQENTQRFVAHWYEELEKNSKIEDYRNSL